MASAFFAIGGLKLHYIDEGQGPVVLLLHGNPTSSYLYRHLISALKTNHRVIAPDHIGFGRSDKPGDQDYSYRLERRISDVEKLLEHLNIHNAITLVVHDWGGPIGLGYAMKHPGAIKKLVVLNSQAFIPASGGVVPGFLRWAKKSSVAAYLIRRFNAFTRLSVYFGHRKKVTADVAAAYIHPTNTWNDSLGVLRFVQDIPLTDKDVSYELLKRIEDSLPALKTVPTLLCWGGRDPVFHQGILAEWKKHLPQAQVQLFENAGHYVLEDETAAVIAAIGGFLNAPPAAGPFCGLVAHLSSAAKENGSQLALVTLRGSLTYAELDRRSEQLAFVLQEKGIVKGTRTVMMIPPGLDFFCTAFALMKCGAVAVLLDPAMGLKNLKQCIDQVAPEAFIGIPKAHIARLLFRWGAKTLRHLVVVRPGWLSKKSSRNAPLPEMKGADPVAIAFTSGSTGVPKGVVYSHEMFLAEASLLKEHFQIQPGERHLATFPLFGLFDPLMRVTTILPDMDFSKPVRVNASKLLQTMSNYQTTHLFASPAVLQRLEGVLRAHPETQLPFLKRILSAGAPVPLKTLEEISRHLSPAAMLCTPYGATEALPLTSIDLKELLSLQGQGVCVGRPLKNVNIAVIKITDGPIPVWSDDLVVAAGVVGEVVVWGPNVSKEYFANPVQNNLSKIKDGSGAVRHRMGDLGYVDEKGRLWFCGRKSQRVVTPAGPLFTVPCEQVFNAHPAVLRTALVGIGAQPHQEPVICVELKKENGFKNWDTIQAELKKMGAAHVLTQKIEKFIVHGAFPVDLRHNSKILHEKLAVWAAGRIR